MTKPETRPDKGTLQGYVSPTEAEKFAGRRIGPNRRLSVFEEADMLATGLPRKAIAGMMPEALEKLADLTVSQSDIFLGS